MKRPPSDSVTVIVFKDNLTSRAFQLPLGWVSRLGWLVLGLATVTLLTAGAAFRFYWAARQADPIRVMDLEQELAEAREALTRKAGITPLPLPVTSASPLAEAPVVPSYPVAVASPTASPVAAVRFKAPATPLVLAPAIPPATTTTALTGSVSAPNRTSFLGGNLVRESVPAEDQLTFKTNDLRASWNAADGLEVVFNLVYTKKDGGSQRGRIVVLARGPGFLASYPAGALGQTGEIYSIRPKEGEYFSVGRFREVLADFPAVKDPKQVTLVEVLIYDSNQKLLINRSLNVSNLPR